MNREEEAGVALPYQHMLKFPENFQSIDKKNHFMHE